MKRSFLLALLLATMAAADPTPKAFPVQHTDAEWRKILTPQQYSVLRHAATDPPGPGGYTDTTAAGTYSCAACGNLLFKSDTKFHSGCGWPSFNAAVSQNHVVLRSDDSLGMHRVEVLCANCGSHLGHVFDDGPPPTGKRYCINSSSLKFEPKGK